MSLTSALSTAQSALFSTSRQTGVVSRNIAEANNPDYSRRSAVHYGTAPGVQANVVQRATNEALFRHNLAATASWQGQSTLLAGMERLGLLVNGIDNAASPAIAIGKLQDTLQLYAAAPSNMSLASKTIDQARHLARTLNDATLSLQQFRSETDTEIATAVGELNTLLSEFHRNNTEIVKGTNAGRDISDALDRRDSLLKQISGFVAISTYTRGANDMVITTADGSTLFETMPRTVSFQPTLAYVAGMSGNPVLVDGVPLKAGVGGDSTANGRLAALLQMRDTVAPTMQNQLDEIARGLVMAFAETDSAGIQPDAPGLFTWPGAPAMPAAGTLVPGLAGAITIHATMDPAAGGDARLLRDGGANGPAYVANPAGAASFADLLIAYSERLDQPIAFDPVAKAGDVVSVKTFSTNAISWFEAQRQESFRAEEAKKALVDRSAIALSNATGVNIDEEMSRLLELEQTYEASTRIIRVVDAMLAALMEAVR
jgi:flagellar hook-associated protein 1 FlgK